MGAGRYSSLEHGRPRNGSVWAQIWNSHHYYAPAAPMLGYSATPVGMTEAVMRHYTNAGLERIAIAFLAAMLFAGFASAVLELAWTERSPAARA
jgi:hypothetical protein